MRYTFRTAVPICCVLLLLILSACGRTELGDRQTSTTFDPEDAGTSDAGFVDGGQSDGGESDGGFPETCLNEVQDGQETDIDCGGAGECRRCEVGESCVESSDCVSLAYCEMGVCEGKREFADPCANSEQCLSEQCLVDYPSSNFCTEPCGEDGSCPPGGACFEMDCFPADYCEDVDGDGVAEGPGCMVMDCSDCDANASCVQAEDGTEFCVCNEGWSGNGQTCSDVDECADLSTCGVDAVCVNELGGFRCACPPGFEGDPNLRCVDINECTNGMANCSQAADCTNERGGFMCTCRAGFTGDGVTCMDIDECALDIDGCDTNATCVNRRGGFECRCNAGFTGDGFTCTPADQCNPNPCDMNATCMNGATGAAVCTCNPGYTGDGFSCTDVDECANGTDNCDPNASCTNTPGAFTCSCGPGYTGDGITCTDVDECAAGTDNCSANATCTNTPGAFTCACNPGFMGDGVMCIPTANCMMDPTVCDTNASCQTDAAGVSACVCNMGWMGDGFVCVDEDECANGTDNCDPNAVCTNTPGAFTCACPMGFTGDGLTCTDIDECADGTDNCDPIATCTNTPGSFTCACPSGYSGDGTTCTDINECALGTDNCGPNSICTNTPGAFTCTCAPGTTLINGQCRFPGDTCDNAYNIPSVPFFGAGDTRGSTDDYSLPAGTCGSFGSRGSGAGDDVWSFTPTVTGTYNINVTDDRWSSAVYILTDCASSGSCIDQDPFDPSLQVSLTAGTTYYIVVDSASNPGFRPEGPYNITVELDECASGTDNCSADATCTNNPVGFTCSCNSGFIGDGVNCTDIDECATNADNCSPNATCTNTPGGFDCTCNAGYTGTGQVCILSNGPGETCTNPNVISSVPYTYTGDTSLRLDDYSVGFNECTGINGGGQGSPDEVFSFTPTTTASYTFNVTGSFSKVVYLATDCTSIGSSCMQGDLAFSSQPATITLPLTAGTTYFFIVDGLSSFSDGQYTLTVTQI